MTQPHLPPPTKRDVLRASAGGVGCSAVSIALVTSPLAWYVAIPIAIAWIFATGWAYRRRWGHRWPIYNQREWGEAEADWPALTLRDHGSGLFIFCGVIATILLIIFFEYVVWSGWD